MPDLCPQHPPRLHNETEQLWVIRCILQERCLSGMAHCPPQREHEQRGGAGSSQRLPGQPERGKLGPLLPSLHWALTTQRYKVSTTLL